MSLVDAYEFALQIGIVPKKLDFGFLEPLLRAKLQKEPPFIRRLVVRSFITIESSASELLEVSRDPRIFEGLLTSHRRRLPTRRKPSSSLFSAAYFLGSPKPRHPTRLQRLLVTNGLRFLQVRILGYRFRNESLLVTALDPSDNNRDMQRLEFLGDTAIELVTLTFVRRFALRLKRDPGPDFYAGIKTIVLSTEGLATLCVYHKVHTWISQANLSLERAAEVRRFVEQKDFDQTCRHLWWRSQKKAPKILADVFEAVCGAVLVDGGWKALTEVVGRLIGPFVFFSAKFFSEIGRNIVGDITAYYRQKGGRCSRRRRVQVPRRQTQDDCGAQGS